MAQDKQGSITPDRVDSIIEQWNQERPDLDVSAMAVIGRIGRLERLIRPRLNEVFTNHGLESWEFDVLATLLRSGQPYRLTAGRLLESTMVTSGAMTNRIDRLSDRGLVLREQNPADKRQVLVALTDKGLTTVSGALLDHTRNENELLSALDGSERDQLIGLLRRLHRSLDAPQSEQPG